MDQIFSSGVKSHALWPAIFSNSELNDMMHLLEELPADPLPPAMEIYR